MSQKIIKYSVIIPTLNESSIIKNILSVIELQKNNLPYDIEIIISDGNSSDDTIEICRKFNVVIVNSEMGRGNQLSSGAKISKGGILIFLHADVGLPNDFFAYLDEHFDSNTNFAAFRMELDVKNLLYKLYSFFTRFDTVFTTFGDQGLIVRRNFYNEIGGFKEIPLMEDVDLIIRARRKTKITKFKKGLTVSRRRFDRVGIIKTQLKSFISIIYYLIGVDPNKIYKFYYSDKNEKQKSNNPFRKISRKGKSKNSISFNNKQ